MKPRDIKILNSSRDFRIDELFFSITNQKGIITACNDVFVRVSGYTSDQLLGKAHNCIRHPDMPRCVFKILWDYLLADRNVGAYVKNLAATGEYYWVYALVTPVEEGFLSIRIKPTSKYFVLIENLYKNLLEIESAYGRDFKEGMVASTQELLTQIKYLGFNNYDSFFKEALREELVARELQIEKSPLKYDRSNTVALQNGRVLSIDKLFNQIVELVDKKNLISDKTKLLSEFAIELELIAINSTVQASILGAEGLPLAVIGEEVSRMSLVIKKEVEEFMISTLNLVSVIDIASLSVATASLQQEMSKYFSTRIHSEENKIDSQIVNMGKSAESLVILLDSCAIKSVGKAISEIKGLLETISKFSEFIEALSKVFQVLQFSYVGGCAEMARISRENEFKSLFEGLNKLSNDANDQLKILSFAIGRIRESIKKTLYM